MKKQNGMGMKISFCKKKIHNVIANTEREFEAKKSEHYYSQGTTITVLLLENLATLGKASLGMKNKGNLKGCFRSHFGRLDARLAKLRFKSALTSFLLL